jgi:elongator complex protein 3
MTQIQSFRRERSLQEREVAEAIIYELLKAGEESSLSLEDVKNKHTALQKITSVANVTLLSAYEELTKSALIPKSEWLRRKLRKRRIRTLSGISPISVLTKPFPCPGKCVYCPTERAPADGKTLFEIDSEKKYGIQKIPKKYKVPGALVMPKSYISSEPAAMKALLNGFDPWKQVTNRIQALKATGHTPEKCELIVMGGTFSFLPKRYQTWFVKRCIQALNGDSASRKSIDLVQGENETAPARAIGIVLETRPDHMNENEARRFRRMGCTRVEIGVQTLDDEVSHYTKRGHGKAEVAVATKILRDAGYKICHHMMPGLPGSTPEKDLQSFKELYGNSDYKPDYLKIYPCLVTPFSELQKWHAAGKFIPYTNEELIPLLLSIKKMTPPWVRITRLIRDIPGTAILAGSKVTNLRQDLQRMMAEAGEKCRCIRCREIGLTNFDPKTVILKREEYEAADGREIFLSFETTDEKLVALLRLRIPSWFFSKNPGKPIYPILRKCALVRELHAYGELTPIGVKLGKGQHSGFGKRLLAEAERIVKMEYGISKVAIISGIGVKEYYRKHGYREISTYMVKDV